ncbi:CHRD domain-containing protein [Streptomyces sp. NPDC049597]|uniref:CHRD domain-containing protein n=1 Tax=Streptomyces sp. NPDC049597 TaxID=3155276 RepID=UPI00341437DE
MHKRHVSVSAAAALVLAAAAGAVPASAHDSHASGHGTAKDGAVTFTKPAHGHAVTFAAVLTGAHEVAEKGGPAVNDPDGRAVALVKVKGDRVVFAMQWKGFVPSQGHIHEGAAGRNGDVKVPLFGTEMPDTVHSAAGHTVLTDAKLADSIREHPSGFYLNLHSKEFPGGAVRGQLKRLKRNINPLHIIKGGKLRALANGAQEVPVTDPHKVGDDDGYAVTFLHPAGRSVDFSLAWVDIQAPQAAHIHKGGFGKNGDVVLGLLNKPVPEGLFAVSGRLEDQHKGLLKEIRHNPWAFYSNIHTKKFPDGAVRGQLFH